MLPNYRIRGAVVQPGITGFTLCLLECVNTVTCSGFEVDTRTGTCYFHDDTTICNQPKAYFYRSLYRLDKCREYGGLSRTWLRELVANILYPNLQNKNIFMHMSTMCILSNCNMHIPSIIIAATQVTDTPTSRPTDAGLLSMPP